VNKELASGGGSAFELAAYLHFGFLPRVEPEFRTRPWSRLPAAHLARVEDCNEAELLTRGVEHLRRVCAPSGERTQIVPLSGGIDSRLLLGELVQAGAKEQVVAVTFGVPGALDFDLAPAVARAAGVQHECLDLTDWPLTRAELLSCARTAPWSFTYEVFYNHLVFRRFGPEPVYWSGNQANSVAGEDAHTRHASWSEACADFAAGTPAQRSTRLTPQGFRPGEALPGAPPLEDTCLTHVEQLFMLVRNPCRNDRAQLPAGFEVRAPFREAEWVEFMLAIPAEIRRAGAFYQELATRAAPALFALPLKSSYGLEPGAPAWRITLRRARQRVERGLRRRLPRALTGPNPKLNYADFDRELRGEGALARVVEESLVNLAHSGALAWLDPLELWRQHRARRANLGDALVLLSALELNLAANGSPAPLRTEPGSHSAGADERG